jgi:hypothetical protein
VLTVDPDLDLSVVKGADAEWTSAGLTGLDLSNLFPDTGWSAAVALNNYSGSKSIYLDSASVSLNYDTEVVSFAIPYSKANTALGMVDPGTWTLYATQTIDDIENIVELVTGNLQIKMYN